MPRVLLIGDSVSRGYTLPVRAALAGKANVHRAPENCGPTVNGLKKIEVFAFIAPQLAATQNPNDVHFNARGYELLGQQVARAIAAELR